MRLSDIILGSGVFALIAFFCMRRSPSTLLINVLLHTQATWMCAGVCWRKAVETWRVRYRECYERVVEEIK